MYYLVSFAGKHFTESGNDSVRRQNSCHHRSKSDRFWKILLWLWQTFLFSCIFSPNIPISSGKRENQGFQFSVTSCYCSKFKFFFYKPSGSSLFVLCLFVLVFFFPSVLPLFWPPPPTSSVTPPAPGLLHLGLRAGAGFLLRDSGGEWLWS